ncbi:MAG: MFS transporter [Planctomycetales bacterium]|nr:MFS transporter [Planctomycetales bacterium]
MPESTPQASSPQDRVSANQLLAYGMGGVIPIALFNIAGQLIQLLGNISLGLSAFWLGAILFVPRLWDALSDPIMGHLTDNTRSRWGRRRPYILVGGIAVALSFAAMWWVPRDEAWQSWFGGEAAFRWFQLGYILAAALMFYTACTVFEIPHGALGMELSNDSHERTRLFGARSFLGNLFAMGTPWLLALASKEVFCGPGGDFVVGMRSLSLLIATVLAPMAVWWFFTLVEPTSAVSQRTQRTPFWEQMQQTAGNRTFLGLVAIVFTLAMGFNFVSNFANYITIFYLFDAAEGPASTLMGYTGMVWAVTALVAVFPLNWASRRYGKIRTLQLSIILMAVAQISKIVCYDPAHPQLVFIPTMLLSAGMLMFFTLGASMVGDVCDENELRTGRRAEGAYYSIFWWFIKLGTALASFVTGVLLVVTGFDEQQNVLGNALLGEIGVVTAQVEKWGDAEVASPDASTGDSAADLATEWDANRADIESAAKKLHDYFSKQEAVDAESAARLAELTQRLERTVDRLATLPAGAEIAAGQRRGASAQLDALRLQLESLKEEAASVKSQAPRTLLLLRVIEIGLPLVVCLISLVLTVRYPLTEQRCYEIKQLLAERKQGARST